MMNVFQYGSTPIEWEFQEADIKKHTITVEKGKPVLLRGQSQSMEDLEKLIKKKARWITQKMQAMAKIKEGDIVSGSRIKYSGRSYMVMIELSDKQLGASVRFNGSKFYITVEKKLEDPQPAIQRALERFYRNKAEERLVPRVHFWEGKTDLQATGIKIFKFSARWASCSEDNVLEFHPRCMELSPKVLDYVIVHELVHTIEHNHTKEFWKLVAMHFPNWEECHGKLDWEL